MNHVYNKSKLSVLVSGTWLLVSYTVWLLDLIIYFYYDTKLGPPDNTDVGRDCFFTWCRARKRLAD